MDDNVAAIRDQLISGVDVDLEDKRGRSALYWASLYGNIDAVSYLLAEGASITLGASWKAGTQPIHVAARHGNIDVLRILIQHGADVNAVNRLGMTPLHAAAWNQQAEAVSFLIKTGADVNQTTNDKRTALHLDKFELSSYEREQYEKIVIELLQAGANPNVKTQPRELTPLMYACYVDSMNAVRMLAKAGANITAMSSSGETAMSLAIKNNNSMIVDYLAKTALREGEDRPGQTEKIENSHSPGAEGGGRGTSR